MKTGSNTGSEVSSVFVHPKIIECPCTIRILFIIKLLL